MKLTVLGARGSMPATGKEYIAFGGNTTSYLIETKTQMIYLDAGTGILKAPSASKKISILISHPHFDHLMGLPFFKPLYCKNQIIEIYGADRNGLTIGEQIGKLMSPPLWPVRLEIFPAKISYERIKGKFQIGDAEIDILENGHPGGCTAFRITAGERSIVFSGDYEHDYGDGDKNFTEFAAQSDLLIYDAQYTSKEYERKRSFGHSTPEMGLELMKQSGAKQILFTHHDPFHTDVQMDEMERMVKSVSKNASFAREGEVIEL